MVKKWSAGLFLLLLTTCIFSVEQKGKNFMFSGKLAEIGIPASSLSGDWSGPTGLVVEDLTSIDHLSAEQKKIVKPFSAQARETGVVSLAAFTYTKKSDSRYQVTVRIFIFSTGRHCQEWIEKKYTSESVKKYYKKVSGEKELTFDSTQINKRIVAFGNVWITSGMSAAGQDHIKMLNLYIEKIKKGNNQAK
jgi:hypothetical protein